MMIYSDILVYKVIANSSIFSYIIVYYSILDRIL